MATRLARLYEEDFYAWTKDQAAALRRLADTRPNADLDFEHLEEEVRDLGVSERNAVGSQLLRVIEHLLKLEHSPAREPRLGWLESVSDARTQIELRLTASMEHDVAASLPRLYAMARRETARKLRQFGETAAAEALPAECPYSLAQLLDPDWYPPEGAKREG